MIADLSNIAFGLVCVLFAGANSAFLIIRRDRSFPVPLWCALSYVLGLGVITVQMFFYALWGIPFSPWSIMIPYCVLFVRNVYYYHRLHVTGESLAGGSQGPLDRLLFAGVIFQCAHAFFKALMRPMDSFDSIGNFAFKAKVFFMTRTIPYSFFANPAHDVQHVDYPLFIPLSETWLALCLGRWDDIAVKILFPLFFVSILVFMYYAVRRFASRRCAVIAVFLLATIPHFLNYATIGYADFALTMFFCASFFFLFRWTQERQKTRLLVLALLCALLAVWAKHEGIMLALVNCAVLLIYGWKDRRSLQKTDVVRIACFITVLALVCYAWLSFLHAMDFPNEFINKDTLHIGRIVKNIPRLGLVAYEYQKHIFGPKKWNLSLFLFFLGLALFYKKAFGGRMSLITWAVLLPLAGYAAVFVVTPLEIRYHLQTAGSRLLLHILPLAVFWLVYAVHTIERTTGERLL